MKNTAIWILVLFLLGSCSLFQKEENEGKNGEENGNTQVLEENIQEFSEGLVSGENGLPPQPGNLSITQGFGSIEELSTASGVFINLVNPEHEAINAEESKKYGETIKDIIAKTKEQGNSIQSSDEQYVRAWIYEFLIFCKGLVDQDINDIPVFISYLGEDTQLLYNYMKENNSLAPDSQQMKDFLDLNGLDTHEPYMILYLTGEISKEELFDVFDRFLLQKDSGEESVDKALYIHALKFKFNENISEAQCENIVWSSDIPLE